LWPGEPVRSTLSGAGRFVSVTAVVEARSQAQLDAIYQELSDCAQVLMAL
jgi:putative lipoic acid-binding regulatory protein